MENTVGNVTTKHASRCSVEPQRAARACLESLPPELLLIIVQECTPSDWDRTHEWTRAGVRRAQLFDLALVAPVFHLPATRMMWESLYIRGYEEAKLWLGSEATKEGRFVTKTLRLMGERWGGLHDMTGDQATSIMAATRGVTHLSLMTVDDLSYDGFTAPSLKSLKHLRLNMLTVNPPESAPTAPSFSLDSLSLNSVNIDPAVLCAVSCFHQPLRQLVLEDDNSILRTAMDPSTTEVLAGLRSLSIPSSPHSSAITFTACVSLSDLTYAIPHDMSTPSVSLLRLKLLPNASLHTLTLPLFRPDFTQARQEGGIDQVLALPSLQNLKRLFLRLSTEGEGCLAGDEVEWVAAWGKKGLIIETEWIDMWEPDDEASGWESGGDLYQLHAEVMAYGATLGLS